MKRPQIPGAPKVAELTQANLMKQQKMASDNNESSYEHPRIKAIKPESRGSKRSTTNQTTASGKVGFSNLDVTNKGGPQSEHPSTSAFN